LKKRKIADLSLGFVQCFENFHLQGNRYEMREIEREDVESSKADFVDINSNSRPVYRYRRNAIYQRFGCPLYISDEGYLYLAYSTCNYETVYEDYLVYKIKDINKFKSLMTKLMLVG
jgi:hypothetical protein